MTPENIRFHAAGHLAAAITIASAHPRAAKEILDVVETFANHPLVSAPPQLKDKLAAAKKSLDPQELTTLEAWFVDPFNTQIEASGARF